MRKAEKTEDAQDEEIKQRIERDTRERNLQMGDAETEIGIGRGQKRRERDRKNQSTEKRKRKRRKKNEKHTQK